ncbi:MAG: glycosyltransferase family 2 protein [Acutalibacteraceae bacterium]|jgi:glycosyltransferase involved in cell wall biosynthesis
MDKCLSVVIPAYNEEGILSRTVAELTRVLDGAAIPFELVFVDDGSSDNTWALIREAAAKDSRVRGVSFSRNFGKEAAIFAGMSHMRGDGCVVIDCDLQHPPEKIVEMVALWNEGYEVIEAVKSSRGKESVFHRMSAVVFYGLISRATGIDMRRASDFKLLDRKAVDVLLTIREKHAFFRALSSWVGFKTTQVEFDVRERTAGASKWSTWSLMKYAVSNVTSFSSAPMHVVTVLGVLMLLVTLVMGIIALCQKIAGVALGGFTTVILLLLFIGSIMMISLGIIGYYISKIYEEIKGRPRYIVSHTCGDDQ